MAEKPIFARAKPSSVHLKEHYFYEKKISRNPVTRQIKMPVGLIETIVPYDGDKHFSRQAFNDIRKQLGTPSIHNNLEAQVGYLSFINYEGTDLRDILGLNSSYGSIPLHIPILGQGITKIEQLCSDTLKSTVTFDYKPKIPEIIPVDIAIELLDEDTLGSFDPETSVEVVDEDEQLISLADGITQQVNFRRNLLIRFRVEIRLPNHMLPKEVRPRVGQVALRWPTITSFRGLHLSIGSPPKDKAAHVIYNPETRNLEWGNILMESVSESLGADIKSFRTNWMELLTDFPGELYQQPALEGQVEIQIPGLLLSGTQVRLFNATGEKTKEYQPKVSTHINLKFELILDEAFARRKLFPYQHLNFDEVIPDKMRIADIRTAILDRGFRVVQAKSLSTELEIRYFIKAERPEGPDTMYLLILIEGNRQEAERETEVKGGQKFRSNTESGDLRVYMRGEMPGNSKRLTREMNALQAALHERFERLRSRR